MTYALSMPLQKAVYEALVADFNVQNLTGGAVYDSPLPLEGEVRPSEYLTLGPERVKENGSATSDGAIHDFSVTVHSSADGFQRSKSLAGAVCDVLLDATLTLDRGELVSLRFMRARADTGRGSVKRVVALNFRAFVEDNPSTI